MPPAPKIPDEPKFGLELADSMKFVEKSKMNPLRKSMNDNRSLERGLWIFGPEYGTIEDTSNEGMTRVIR